MPSNLGNRLLQVLVPSPELDEVYRAFFQSVRAIMAGYAGEETIFVGRPGGLFWEQFNSYLVRNCEHTVGSGSQEQFQIDFVYVDEAGNAAITALADTIGAGRLQFQVPEDAHETVINTVLAEAQGGSFLQVQETWPTYMRAMFFEGICAEVVTRMRVLRSLLDGYARAASAPPGAFKPAHMTTVRSALLAEVEAYTALGECQVDKAWRIPKPKTRWSFEKDQRVDTTVVGPTPLASTYHDIEPTSYALVRRVYSWYGFLVWRFLMDIEDKNLVIFCESCGIPIVKRPDIKKNCTKVINPLGYETCQKLQTKGRVANSRKKKKMADRGSDS